MRNGILSLLLLSACFLSADLGDLRPTGKINPDGSQVYGYPPGSGLEGIIEVHVGPGGQVVREKVLRPEPASDPMIAEELEKSAPLTNPPQAASAAILEELFSFLVDHQERRR